MVDKKKNTTVAEAGGQRHLLPHEVSPRVSKTYHNRGQNWKKKIEKEIEGKEDLLGPLIPPGSSSQGSGGRQRTLRGGLQQGSVVSSFVLLS